MSGAITCPYDCTQVRYIRKHWNPKFKKLRRLKVIKIKLPNFQKEKDPVKFEKEQMRSHIKEFGFIPQKPWRERMAYISCTPVIFESYVAPEGDGKYSAITKEVFFFFSISEFCKCGTIIFLYNTRLFFFK